MSSDVLKLVPQSIGEDFRFDPDEILEDSKGKPFEKIAIMGEMEDGELWISGNASYGEVLILMEKIKRMVVFGEGA